MSYIHPLSEFTLRWHIRYNDHTVDIGQVQFMQIVDESTLVGDESDDAVETGIRPINVPEDFKSTILPIFVHEMTLLDECETADLQAMGLVVPYEEASFVIEIDGKPSHGCIDFSWGLTGCGFGQFYISCVGGYPRISNEMMGKLSILEIFKHL